MVEYKPIPAWMPLEDINLDGLVDARDATRVCLSYGLREGEAGYDPLCDINGDGVVDARDVTRIILAFRSTSGPPERKVQTGLMQVQKATATAMSGLASVATFTILAEAAKGIVKTLRP